MSDRENQLARECHEYLDRAVKAEAEVARLRGEERKRCLAVVAELRASAKSAARLNEQAGHQAAADCLNTTEFYLDAAARGIATADAGRGSRE